MHIFAQRNIVFFLCSKKHNIPSCFLCAMAFRLFIGGLPLHGRHDEMANWVYGVTGQWPSTRQLHTKGPHSTLQCGFVMFCRFHFLELHGNCFGCFASKTLVWKAQDNGNCVKGFQKQGQRCTFSKCCFSQRRSWSSFGWDRCWGEACHEGGWNSNDLEFFQSAFWSWTWSTCRQWCRTCRCNWRDGSSNPSCYPYWTSTLSNNFSSF